MKVICPKCGADLAKVISFGRVRVQVLCPVCGHNFGLPVKPETEPEHSAPPGEQEPGS